MIISVAYDLLRWEEKDLISKIRSSGHKLAPIYLKDFSATLNDISMESDAVVQRSVSHKRALLSSAIFEGANIFTVNNANTINLCQNKLISSMMLLKAGIRTPKTAIAFDENTALAVAKQIGYPVVVKPIEGSWGRMVAKADNEENLRTIIEYHKYTSTYFNSVFMIQEFVNKPNRDIRIFSIGDEAPVGIYRVNDKNWKTNTALGAKAEPLHPNEELRELAIKTSELFHGFFLGIDVFEDPKEGYIVNEVNSVPEYKNTVRVNNFDISSFLINKIKEVVKK